MKQNKFQTGVHSAVTAVGRQTGGQTNAAMKDRSRATPTGPRHSTKLLSLSHLDHLAVPPTHLPGIIWSCCETQVGALPWRSLTEEQCDCS